MIEYKKAAHAMVLTYLHHLFPLVHCNTAKEARPWLYLVFE